MMLDYFKLFEEANLIREAVQHTIDKGLSTVDVNPENPQSTSAVGDLIAAYIAEAVVTA
ncbi:3-isopropylmalate dehydrogenase [compost metagenome]